MGCIFALVDREHCTSFKLLLETQVVIKNVHFHGVVKRVREGTFCP